ncbi:MAG: YihA family ribosome biogenesis GTP-binding protein [Deltaproteobacteria bacterium]|nr:YihA family ribosome biogenesis GTP-binding protein [Deltaproteobacteria bacterium]
MKITSAEFIKSALKKSDCPKESLPEVAFAGRSNVGKSSLINIVLNRKNLARTSSSPGRTQMLNFFRINDQIYFVDLPGYGFAKVPVGVRAQWKPMVEDYLKNRKTLKLIILLLDIRRAPNSDDASFIRWLEKFSIPFLVVLTKSDKVSKNKCSAQRKVIKEFLLLKDEELVFFSTVTREGKQDILKRIVRIM